MDFRSIAEQRYTTKKFDATKTIPKEKIEDLKHILKLSPSSINSQPWLFSFVSHKETKNALADASFFNAPKIKNASHLVICLLYTSPSPRDAHESRMPSSA